MKPSPDTRPERKARADFLWPHEPDSVEEAGYELLNAQTEAYRERWWAILMGRCGQGPVVKRRGKPRGAA